MKILSCHNYYQQRGGEDQSFEDEVALLREAGDDVVTYTRHNDEIEDISRLSVAAQTIWSRRSAREISALIKQERPDIVHFTNTFPLISPSVYRQARRAGVAVVQSLRNFRLGCAGAYFLRDGNVCEDCLGKAVPWPAVKHRCYRGSLAGSLAVAGMQTVHHRLGTWRRGVDLFYTLTQFSREKCVQMGLPADRIVVKPNCVQPDPGVGAHRGDYVVFAGRLSPEKGVDTLLDAWSMFNNESSDNPFRLKIIGGGPLENRVAEFAAQHSHVEHLGPMPHSELLDVIGDARALVMPSVWYETFGRTIIEAYAKGVPVIASRLGAMQELVHDGQTGLHFDAGDAGSLAKAVRKLSLLPPEEIARWRTNCRQAYLDHYTPQNNYTQLQTIYDEARRNHRLTVAQQAARSQESGVQNSQYQQAGS